MALQYTIIHRNSEAELDRYVVEADADTTLIHLLALATDGADIKPWDGDAFEIKSEAI